MVEVEPKNNCGFRFHPVIQGVFETKKEFLTDLNGIQIIGPIIVVSKIVVGHVVIVVVVIIVVVALVRIDVADHVGGHGHG